MATKSNIKIFDDLEQVFALSQEWGSSRQEEREWAGGRTLVQGAAYVRRGATEYETEPARALIDKVDASVHDRDSIAWMPSVAGAYPVVGEYLMGQPECMRARMQMASDASPIRLVAMVSVAASMDDEDIVQRAAAIAALAQRMSEERPVELWAMHYFHNEITKVDVGFMVKLDTGPISLAQVVAVFSKTFARLIGFSALDVLADCHLHAGYPFEAKGASAYTNRYKYIENVRDYFGLEPQDILIDGGLSTDEDAISRNPVKWVHDRLAEQRNLD